VRRRVYQSELRLPGEHAPENIHKYKLHFDSALVLRPRGRKRDMGRRLPDRSNSSAPLQDLELKMPSEIFETSGVIFVHTQKREYK